MSDPKLDPPPLKLERRCHLRIGLSIRNCYCRLPVEGGWLECPSRPWIKEIDPPRLVPRLVTTGELCRQENCGGMMIRTGSCMTCQSCGYNEGCG